MFVQDARCQCRVSVGVSEVNWIAEIEVVEKDRASDNSKLGMQLCAAHVVIDIVAAAKGGEDRGEWMVMIGLESSSVS